uniref:Ig-like domain-containing protein n=1 Tax=Phlebotomus papatasi TaxID=29031 RepID=A0A1B0DMD3_PHLPP
GYPKPIITWKKAIGASPGEYKDFLYEPNVVQYPNGTIHFKKITKESQGHFLCEAKNEIGSGVSKVIFLKVNVAAHFAMKNKQIFIARGKQVHIQCNVQGDTPIDLKWRIQNSQQHLDESIDASAKVNIYGPPFIREMPKITGVSGKDLVIKCPVAGYPIDKIHWERDGQTLPINRRQRAYANGTLIIEQLQRLEDAGTYTCMAQSREKQTARRNVEIQVLVPPKIMPIQAMTNMLREGMRAAISCQILEGDLPVSFRWERNGKPVIGTGNEVIRRLDEYSASLVVEHISSEHSGNYSCIASNVAGTEKFTVPLTVNVPPKWVIEPKDSAAQFIGKRLVHDASPELLYWFSEQTLQPGPTVSLKCVATGNPPPQFQWTLDGFPIPDSSRFLVGQYVTIHDDVISHVNISNVKDEDGGEYSCTAQNSIGK